MGASPVLGLALALGSLAGTGCAPPPVRLEVPTACRHPRAQGLHRHRVREAAARAAGWLKVEQIKGDIVVCSDEDLSRLGKGKGKAEARHEPHDLVKPGKKNRRIKAEPRMMAVRSFSGDPSGILSNRSYIYDNALALIWYAWTGDQKSSRGIASTLMASQGEAGAWGAYLPLSGTDCYNEHYVRNGIVGWAAYALSYYSRKYSSDAARRGAERAAGYLESELNKDVAQESVGLVRGGRGRWARGERFEPSYRFASAVTEHQFDAQLALASMGRPTAAPLAKQIMDRLWLKDEGRFALAAHADRVDQRRALDAAGAWGSLWLLARGERAAALRSLRYTTESFCTRDRSLAGYRPYLDPVEGPGSVEPKDLIFVEGSLGVGLAAHRLGEKALARQALGMAAQLSYSTGGGLPYANVEAAGFTILPGAASTLWFLFLEREMRSGEPSPLFPSLPGSPGERETRRDHINNRGDA